LRHGDRWDHSTRWPVGAPPGRPAPRTIRPAGFVAAGTAPALRMRNADTFSVAERIASMLGRLYRWFMFVASGVWFISAFITRSDTLTPSSSPALAKVKRSRWAVRKRSALAGLSLGVYYPLARRVPLEAKAIARSVPHVVLLLGLRFRWTTAPALIPRREDPPLIVTDDSAGFSALRALQDFDRRSGQGNRERLALATLRAWPVHRLRREGDALPWALTYHAALSVRFTSSQRSDARASRLRSAVNRTNQCQSRRTEFRIPLTDALPTPGAPPSRWASPSLPHSTRCRTSERGSRPDGFRPRRIACSRRCSRRREAFRNALFATDGAVVIGHAPVALHTLPAGEFRDGAFHPVAQVAAQFVAHRIHRPGALAAAHLGEVFLHRLGHRHRRPSRRWAPGAALVHLGDLGPRQTGLGMALGSARPRSRRSRTLATIPAAWAGSDAAASFASPRSRPDFLRQRPGSRWPSSACRPA
jgi:hypothetical protein